jgi:hypothetical protein
VPIATALAASSRPRRGAAVSDTQISLRRYSAVMNIAATTISGISPKNVPASARWRDWPFPPYAVPAAGPMSPKLATVSVPALWRSVPRAGTPKFGPPTLVPVHPVAGQESPM